MGNTEYPSRPVPDSEKFKPQNVAGAGRDSGRKHHNTDDVARGAASRSDAVRVATGAW